MFLLLGIIIIFAACDESNTESSDKQFAGEELVIASYGGTLDEAVSEYVVKPFEEETGATVIMDPSYDFTNLLSEGDNPTVDLMYLDDARVIEGAELDILEELDTSKISHWDNLFEQAKFEGNHGVAWVFGSYGLVYNKEEIEEPTSWQDLWNPEYQGKVAVNDLVSNGGVQAFVEAAKSRGGDERNIEPAFESYKELAPNLLTISASTAQLTDMLTRGEVLIAPWWDGRALTLEDNGGPVGYTHPEEGSYATIVTFSIPKGAENQELAHKFIDMSLEPEAQIGFAEMMYYGPTNKETELPDELAERVIYGEDMVESLQFVDWEYIATVRSEWIERWNQEIVPLLQ
jgi:putative spermidine/putrescine transport system substrate-binding protein